MRLQPYLTKNFCVDLSHLNNGGLMTPKEEVEETIKIKETLPLRKTHTHTEITIMRRESVARENLSADTNEEV
jgi:hypothetical protein